MCDVVFFFKQKTAYEMRISDWSSDGCSSDLRKKSVAVPWLLHLQVRGGRGAPDTPGRIQAGDDSGGERDADREHEGAVVGGQRTIEVLHESQHGRASCRERVCQYV